MTKICKGSLELKKIWITLQKFLMRDWSAGGLIIDSITNQILVVAGTEKWSLPNGHRISGETWYQTGMREIYEETSLKFELRASSQKRRIMKMCLLSDYS